MVSGFPTIKTDIMLVKELRLSYEVTGKEIYNNDNEGLKNSEAVAKFLREIYGKEILIREKALVVMLSQANKVLGYSVIGEGGITGVVMDTRVIFSLALLTPGCTNIIISHNHPSGNLMTSNSDVEVTKKIKKAGEVMDIKLLDHLIVTDEGYYSFLDNGNL